MLVPDKITLFLDTATLIAALGFIIAACAIVMLKNGIERLIQGNPHKNWARLQSLITITIALLFLSGGLIIILESHAVLAILSEQMNRFLSFVVAKFKIF